MSMLLFFVFGLIVGSFLNVVIYRVHSEEGGIVGGRSHCRSCSLELSWFDNIPLLSYLFLRGKCRQCKKHISWQYPLVEMGCGFAFMLAAGGSQEFISESAQSGYGIAALSALVFAVMIVIFVYDLKYMEVPMIAIWIGVTFCIALLVLMTLLFPRGESFFGSVFFLHSLSGVIAFLFFFLLSYISHETWMGYGDGFIALIIGLLLGPLATFVAIVIAVWVGTIVGLSLVFFGSRGMKSAIPFGPFLVGGMFSAYVIKVFAPEWLGILW